MSEFIIDSVTHKRWWLPCRCHQYDSILAGGAFRIAILDGRSGEVVTSHYIEIKDGWENISELSQQFANKAHPAPVGRLTNCRIVPRYQQARARIRG